MNKLKIRPRRRLWRLLGWGSLLFVVSVGFALASTFTLSRDAAWLRNELAARDGSDLTMRIQGSGGRVILSTARVIVRHLPDIDPAIPDLLEAVRRVSVGIYEVNTGNGQGMQAASLPAERRGWTRVVAVEGPKQSVLVYVKEPAPGAEQIDFTVAVKDRRQLVVVSATVRPEGLLRLFEAHAARPVVARAN